MFAVCPEGSKKPVLMVPQTMSRNEADVFSGKGFDDELDMQSKDKFKNLITVIPANAKCRISTITQLDGEDEPPLRHDILLLMHEFAAHQGEPYMYEQITEFAWWPSLRTDIRNHIKYCSVCMAKLAARRSAGIGTVISVRFRHLSGDHAILPKWIQEITGYYSVLYCINFNSPPGGSVATIIQSLRGLDVRYEYLGAQPAPIIPTPAGFFIPRRPYDECVVLWSTIGALFGCLYDCEPRFD